MGLRFWIKTEKTPVFPAMVKWQKLDDFVEGMWFFQDEFGESGLNTVLGLAPDIIKDLYRNHPVDLLLKLSKISDDQLITYFYNAYDRPVPYWEELRKITFLYMQGKIQYVTALLDAEITEIKQERTDLPNTISQWYWYRGLGYDEKTNPMTFSRH